MFNFRLLEDISAFFGTVNAAKWAQMATKQPGILT
jgi:hypothetical protein